jgi:Amt family ammonium transporter
MCFAQFAETQTKPGDSMPLRRFKSAPLSLVLAGLLTSLPAPCFAADAELNGADTAWILVSSALVLFMTIPGLFLFYAGLVAKRNVLSLMMQCLALTATVTLLWLFFGYSVAFDKTGMVAGEVNLHSFVGGLSKALLVGVERGSVWATIPEPLFFMFQMTFAIITPALMIGAFAERMKFSAVLAFSLLWVVVVYLPVCHTVWGGEGSFFGDMGVIDFAGGIVVHITAGVGALVACVVIGKRSGYPAQVRRPHNLTMTVTGTAMLWVGWFGFNGGSALSAGADAAMAITVTHISASVGALVWMVIEWNKNGKPSVLGAATGSIAGLAAITPASGSVGPLGALTIGLTSGVLCYFASVNLKAKLGYDDSLDVFGVHGVGGFVGTLLVAVFGAASLGGAIEDLDILNQLGVQAFAAVSAAAYSAAASIAILMLVKAWLGGLRVTEQAEREGLDLVEHEELGYDI